ncbi:MAG TPA: FtsX-like permease family protein, partial [Nocardioidaceae bacterium]|nr:FtsX-like permease family protein [Nocardioidaceae bacterium]
GTALPARTVGTVGTLPLLGNRGVLGDLTTFLDSEPFAAPLGDVVVIARADTPDSVYAALADAGVDPGDRVTIDETRQLLDDDPFAQALRFFWLAAGLVAVIALCAVATVLLSQRPSRAQESAALRVAGMRRHQLRAALVVEVTAVAAFVAACGWLAAWLSTWATLPALPLGEPGDYEPAPDPVITWSSGIVPALVAAIVVGAVAVGLLLPITLRSRPASLRGGGD